MAACAGQGRHAFLDGAYYEGSWVAGERSTGVYVSAGGEMEYRGQWRGLLRHGEGTLFQKGLLKYTGTQPSQLHPTFLLSLIVIHAGWALCSAQGSGLPRPMWYSKSACTGLEVGQIRPAYLSSKAPRRADSRAGAYLSQCHSGGLLFQKGCSSCKSRSLKVEHCCHERSVVPASAPCHHMRHAGEWKEDLQDGLGTCQWVDGTEYRGSWKAGAHCGRGVLSRPDGYTYDGEWAEDICHGTGLCSCEDGSRQGSFRSKVSK